VVVRRPDPTWGEVPVAVVARKDEAVTSAQLLARCRAELAGYKQPKDFVFVTLAELPRSTTGKIQRHEVEAWLRSREADSAPEK
jgi:fatty-acyl-CoA synthase